MYFKAVGVLVLDSMVLIHVTKIGLLNTVLEAFRPVYVPPAVVREVVETGKQRGHADALVVEAALREKHLRVQPPEPRHVQALAAYGLRGGEAEASALARQLKARLACDDDAVRSRQSALAIPLIGTPALIVDLVRTKKLEKERAKIALLSLRKIGWFSPVVLDRAQQVIENV